MPAAVETMAWTSEKPWHGLGVEVGGDLTADEMLVRAGLDWTVSKRKVFTIGATAKDLIEVPGRMALVRDTDHTVLSEVGSRWQPLQNRDALDFFSAFVAKGGATMETAGSLDGGRYIWGLARLGADFTVGSGDAVQGYLLLVSPHVGGKSIIGKVTTVRVVCRNTLELALSTTSKWEARFHHGRAFDPVAAVEAIGIAKEAVVEFAKNARVLKKMRLTDREIVDILAPVYQPGTPIELLRTVGEAAYSPTLMSVLMANQAAPGADPKTAWGLLNAATYHADHHAGKKGADARLTSAWLGTEAGRKQAVLSALLERA